MNKEIKGKSKKSNDCLACHKSVYSKETICFRCYQNVIYRLMNAKWKTKKQFIVMLHKMGLIYPKHPHKHDIKEITGPVIHKSFRKKIITSVLEKENDKPHKSKTV